MNVSSISGYVSSASAFLQTNYKYIGLVVLAILLFSIIGYYASHSSGVKSKYKNIANNGGVSQPVDVYFFYATWCPHCKTALPKWKLFSDTTNGTLVNGSLITTHTIDCTNTDDPNVAHYLNEYGVKGFPTVKASSNGTVVNFESKITDSTLTKFVQQLTE
jgi:thiol-disulfide isomerase/thioredoxin